jgi:hypothetical protein
MSNTAKAPVSFNHQSDGLSARRCLDDDITTRLNADAAFTEKLLLHHMAPSDPDMVLALGTPLSDGNDDIDNYGSDWHFSSRYDSPPFEFRSIIEAPRPARSRTREFKKTHLGLPITLNARGAAATVLACADTGANVNIVSESLAQALGYRHYE